MKISREAHARLTSSRFHAWAHALRDALRDAHAWHASNTRQSVISRVSSRKISRVAYSTDLSTMLLYIPTSSSFAPHKIEKKRTTLLPIHAAGRWRPPFHQYTSECNYFGSDQTVFQRRFDSCQTFKNITRMIISRKEMVLRNRQSPCKHVTGKIIESIFIDSSEIHSCMNT